MKSVVEIDISRRGQKIQNGERPSRFIRARE